MLPYTSSWLANSFNGAGGTFGDNFANKHVPMDIDSIFVWSDGTIYANANVDEGHTKLGFFKNGNLVGAAFENNGGYAVTADQNYIYAGESINPGDFNYYGSGIRRYKRDGSWATFPGGIGKNNTYLLINSAKDAPLVSGLVVNRKTKELFASDPSINQIKVFSTETMSQTPLRTWSLSRPGAIAVDTSGNIWIIQKRLDGLVPGKIICFSPRGKELKRITDVVDPTALAVDNQGRLLVAENGRDQQIRFYGNLSGTPSLVRTFGEKGGYLAGPTPGLVGPRRFNGLTGLGVDSLGNLYVSQNGFGPKVNDDKTFTDVGLGSVLESYNMSTGTRNWVLHGLTFVDNADADPASEVDVYTSQEHFVMDYSKPIGQEWTYKGHLVNRFKYPSDPRLGDNVQRGIPMMRRIQGRLFMYTTDMNGAKLNIFRFNPATDGEVAIPSGVIVKQHYKPYGFTWPPNQPATGEWIWRDSNGNGHFGSAEYHTNGTNTPFAGDMRGNGWWVDSKGDIWQAGRPGIRHFKLQGLDTQDNPMYSYAEGDVESFSTPAPFSKLERIEYYPETDTMYLSGYTSSLPDPGGEFAKVGTIIARYDNWSTGNRIARWQTQIPHTFTGGGGKSFNDILPKAMSVAGDYIFVQYLKQQDCRIYRTSDGSYVGMLTPSNMAPNQHSIWVDHPYGVRAYKRSNGEYLVFVEDDIYSKVIMYRWTPPQ